VTRISLEARLPKTPARIPPRAVGSAASRSPRAGWPRAVPAPWRQGAGRAAAAVEGAPGHAVPAVRRAIPRRRHPLAARSGLGLLLSVWVVSLVGVAVTVGGAA
jgi:hypothetical protein